MKTEDGGTRETEKMVREALSRARREGRLVTLEKSISCLLRCWFEEPVEAIFSGREQSFQASRRWFCMSDGKGGQFSLAFGGEPLAGDGAAYYHALAHLSTKPAAGLHHIESLSLPPSDELVFKLCGSGFPPLFGGRVYFAGAADFTAPGGENEAPVLFETGMEGEKMAENETARAAVTISLGTIEVDWADLCRLRPGSIIEIEKPEELCIRLQVAGHDWVQAAGCWEQDRILFKISSLAANS